MTIHNFKVQALNDYGVQLPNTVTRGEDSPLTTEWWTSLLSKTRINMNDYSKQNNTLNYKC